jgi:hypothetical protein
MVGMSSSASVGAANPYGLPLSEELQQRFSQAISPLSVHEVVGYLLGAVTVPEPIPLAEAVESLEYALSGVRDRFAHAAARAAGDARPVPERGPLADSTDVLEVIIQHIQQRLAAGEIASLIPGASDLAAAQAWVKGFEQAQSSALHDLTEEEGTVGLRIRDVLMGETVAERQAALETLVPDVTRMIELWREVPPYDPSQEPEEPFTATVPKVTDAAASPARAPVQSNTPVKRETPKLGRNDRCPCGSGKKYKKCCG